MMSHSRDKINWTIASESKEGVAAECVPSKESEAYASRSRDFLVRIITKGLPRILASILQIKKTDKGPRLMKIWIGLLIQEGDPP